MKINEIAARVEIDNLISNFSISGDFFRLEKYMTIWTEDAAYLPPGGERVEGRKGIKERMRFLLSALSGGESSETVENRGQKLIPTFLRHNNTSSLIEFQDEEHATGLTYWISINDIGIDACGTYADKYRKEHGKWLIWERKTRIDYLSENTLFEFLRDRMNMDKDRAAKK